MQIKWKRILSSAMFLSLLLPALLPAHLCDDVFLQARDNLAVKVNVRDGQLRIGKEASFQVFLLNTMDRDIANINLEAVTSHFDAQVRPDPSWKSYPKLVCKNWGGKKESFHVTLKRKEGLADGRYSVSLRLFNGEDRSMEFKTVELGEAAGVCVLPVGRVQVDGLAGKTEWGSAPVLAGMTTYQAYFEGNKKYYHNEQAKDDLRCRLQVDGDSLAALFHFSGADAAQGDEVEILLCAGMEDKPMVVKLDRLKLVLSGNLGNTARTQIKASADGRIVECRLPLKELGLSGRKAFLVNVVRRTRVDGKETVAYWKGNSQSFREPVIFGMFRVGK